MTGAVISADTNLWTEIQREDSIVVSLVQLRKDSAYYRLTDAPQAVDALLDPSTNVRTRFEPLDDEISVVGLPEQGDSPDRDLHQIGLFDPNEVWANRFLNSYTRLFLDLYIMFQRVSVVPVEYTRTLHVYHGRGLQAARRFEDDSMQLLLTFGGELTQIDGEFSAVTTHQNQQLRNPLDQCMTFAGKLRTIDWGGTGAVGDDVKPFVKGRTSYGSYRTINTASASGTTYTAPAVNVNLSDVFGGGSLTFSPASGKVALDAVSVTVPNSDSGEETYSNSASETVTATNSAGALTAVLTNTISITTFSR